MKMSEWGLNYINNTYGQKSSNLGMANINITAKVDQKSLNAIENSFDPSDTVPNEVEDLEYRLECAYDEINLFRTTLIEIIKADKEANLVDQFVSNEDLLGWIENKFEGMNQTDGKQD